MQSEALTPRNFTSKLSSLFKKRDLEEKHFTRSQTASKLLNSFSDSQPFFLHHDSYRSRRISLPKSSKFTVLPTERQSRSDQMGLQGRSVAPIILVLVYFSSLTAGRALTETGLTPQVPASIEVPRYKLQAIVHATGHQHYRLNGSKWVLFNATAKLYNLKWQEIGVHYFLRTPDAQGGQPTWDTLPSKGVAFSSVTGKQLAREVVDADSIAWLLLDVTQSYGNKNYFGNTVLIQRYNTNGGLPRTSIAGAHTGDVRKMPYTSDYTKFYV